MGHSRVRAKVRRRKVAALAAYSRQFTVKNTKKGISEVVNHKHYGTEVPKDMIIKSPYSGIEYVMTNPHPIHGEKYGITVTGYDWVPINEYKASTGLLWEHKKYPQPKNLRNKDFPYTLPKMNKTQYMEKLVEHKLARWERKNPAPEAMFVEDVEKWKQERENMKERFRDFVVSIYDKLHLTGRFVVAKENSATYIEEKVAEIKDINGEGHRVNELPKDSPLMKKAQKKTNEVKAKRPNLVATNLKDHKKQKGRIILPEAA